MQSLVSVSDSTRQAIRGYINNKPIDTQGVDFGGWRHVVSEVQTAYEKDGPQGATNVMKVLGKVYPDLRMLMAHGDEPVVQRADNSAMPALPAYAVLPTELAELAAQGCPWLDRYAAFSRHWARGSYDGYHDWVGIWLLSTIAARRVALNYGPDTRYPALYIALVSRSSVYSKSEATKIARKTLETIGLDDVLLHVNSQTPQSFYEECDLGRLGVRFGDMTDDERRSVQYRHGFKASRGWYYEEFGGLLKAMANPNSINAEWHSLLRNLDDMPNQISRRTKTGGIVTIHRPYLPLLGLMTPSDMMPYAKRGASYWTDGFFPRFVFITPPADSYGSDEAFLDEAFSIPKEIFQPLRKWHERLGLPVVTCEEIVRDDKPTGEWRPNVIPVKPHVLRFGQGVKPLVDAYFRALKVMARTLSDDYGGYVRLNAVAYRIAMLFASLEGSDTIEMRHWAKAQGLAEQARGYLHNLIDQVQGNFEPTMKRTIEDSVLRHIRTKKDGQGLTRREIKNYSNAAYPEIDQAIAALVGNGVIEALQVGRTERYVITSPIDEV